MEETDHQLYTVLFLVASNWNILNNHLQNEKMFQAYFQRQIRKLPTGTTAVTTASGHLSVFMIKERK